MILYFICFCFHLKRFGLLKNPQNQLFLDVDVAKAGSQFGRLLGTKIV